MKMIVRTKMQVPSFQKYILGVNIFMPSSKMQIHHQIIYVRTKMTVRSLLYVVRRRSLYVVRRRTPLYPPKLL